MVLISNSLEDIKMSKFQSTEFCCCSSTFFPKPRCLCVHESSRTSAVSVRSVPPMNRALLRNIQLQRDKLVQGKLTSATIGAKCKGLNLRQFYKQRLIAIAPALFSVAWIYNQSMIKNYFIHNEPELN